MTFVLIWVPPCLLPIWGLGTATCSLTFVLICIPPCFLPFWGLGTATFSLTYYQGQLYPKNFQDQFGDEFDGTQSGQLTDVANIQKKKEEEKALKELRAKASQKGSFGGTGLKKSGKK